MRYVSSPKSSMRQSPTRMKPSPLSQETNRLPWNRRLAATLITLPILGLLQVVAVEAQGIAPAPQSAIRSEMIFDPVLRLNAYEVRLPATWRFRGTLVQGTTCIPVPFQVFRITSPDGLSALERLPRLDWAWGNTPAGPDCLPIKTAMSARDLLKYIADTFHVDYVGEERVPPEQISFANQTLARDKADIAPRYAAAGMTPPTDTVDMAMAVVRFRNGSFTMKGKFVGTVHCTHFPNHHQCYAEVRYTTAPEAQFPAVDALMQNAGAIQLAQWNKAWLDFNNQQTAANIRQIQANGAANIARIKANGEQFRQSQQMRQRVHEEFMATMRRGTDMSMNRTKANMDARSRSTSDWVDYALDRQTVRDPGTGQSTKVSSTHSYTWSDGAGHFYQTDNPSYDPNGVLPGTWTRQQKVHGDGSQ